MFVLRFEMDGKPAGQQHMEPHTTLRIALTRFCEQHDVDPSGVSLFHCRLGELTNLDTSFDCSGLRGGDTLRVVLDTVRGMPAAAPAAAPAEELTEVNENMFCSPNSGSKASCGLSVKVAVDKVQSNRRFVGSFSPNSSLLRVLRCLETSNNTLIILHKGGSGSRECSDSGNDTSADVTMAGYMQFVVRILNREFRTVEQLATVTLAKLGMRRGNVLMQVNHVVGDEPLSDDIVARIRDGEYVNGAAATIPPSMPQETARSIEHKADVSHTVVSDRLSAARHALSELDKQATLAEYVRCVALLGRICHGVLTSPADASARTISLTGKLGARVGRFAGAVAFLEAVGFRHSADDPSKGGSSQTLSIDEVRVNKELLGRLLGVLDSVLETHEAELRTQHALREAADTAAASTALEASVSLAASDSPFSFARAEIEEQEALKHKRRDEMMAQQQAAVSIFDHHHDDGDYGGDGNDEARGVSSKRRMWTIDIIRGAVARSKFPAASDDEYISVLGTLAKIVKNLGRQPAKPAYRALNLANAKFRQKVGRFPGALEFLAVVGFAHHDAQRPDVLILRASDEDRILNDRAAVIASHTQKQFAEHVKVQRAAKPVQRCMKIMDASIGVVARTPQSQSQSQSQSQNNAVVSQNDDDNDNRSHGSDLALLLIAQKQQAARSKELNPGKFMFRKEREALAAKRKRTYDVTVIRVLFPADCVIVQANFGPGEPIAHLFEHIRPLLTAPDAHFTLRIPPTTTLHSSSKADYNATFKQHWLVPAATLRFVAESDSSGDKSCRKLPVLKPEHRKSKEKFVSGSVPQSHESACKAAETADMAKIAKIDNMAQAVHPKRKSHELSETEKNRRAEAAVHARLKRFSKRKNTGTRKKKGGMAALQDLLK